MTARPAPAARARLAVLALVLLPLAGACRGGTSDGGGERAGGAARRYTVRGELVRLPQPGESPARVMLRHEPIDDFVNESGAVVGMDAMTMPFEVAPGVSLEGQKPGDKVEVVLAVDWSRPSLRIEQLRKLPADTALRAGKAQPQPAAR